jgi:hypothetical protein
MEAERRQKARLYHSLPLTVRGSEAPGKAYRFEAIAPNIGAGGLCAFAPRIMKIGERISMRVRFARIGVKQLQAPEVSIRGRVVRVEERAAGYCLFAVSFVLRRIV